jgi:hypothetical protein
LAGGEDRGGRHRHQAKAFSKAIEKSHFYGPSKTLSITANERKSSVKLIKQQLQKCAFKT